MSTQDTGAPAGDAGAAAVVDAGVGANTDTGAAAGADVGAGGGGDEGAGKFDVANLERIANEARETAQKATLELARLQGRFEERDAGGKKRELVDPNPEPKPEDYGGGIHDPRYIIDVAKFELRNEHAAERANETTAQAMQRDYETRKARFVKVYEAAAANDDTPNAPAVLRGLLDTQKERGRALADLICESTRPDLIAQHLHVNPKLQADLLVLVGADGKIAKANERDIVRRLGALDASLPGVFQARKVSQAKDVPPVLGGGGGAVNTGYQSNMSTEDYRAARASGRLQ